jgi:hypothetical protein
MMGTNKLFGACGEENEEKKESISFIFFLIVCNNNAGLFVRLFFPTRRHYHSMEVFAHFDIINSFGVKVAEGHKASFCLEDNQCTHNTEPVYKCAN